MPIFVNIATTEKKTADTFPVDKCQRNIEQCPISRSFPRVVCPVRAHQYKNEAPSTSEGTTKEIELHDHDHHDLQCRQDGLCRVRLRLHWLLQVEVETDEDESCPLQTPNGERHYEQQPRMPRHHLTFDVIPVPNTPESSNHDCIRKTHVRFYSFINILVFVFVCRRFG